MAAQSSSSSAPARKYLVIVLIVLLTLAVLVGSGLLTNSRIQQLISSVRYTSTSTQASTLPPPLQSTTSSTSALLQSTLSSVAMADSGGMANLPQPTIGQLTWFDTPPPIPSITAPDNPPFEPEQIENTSYSMPPSPPVTAFDPPVIIADIKVPCAAGAGSTYEPVAANNGQTIFYSAAGCGAAASVDNGKNWQFTGTSGGNFVDLYGNLQCGCDTDVVYAPQINMFIWYRQGGGNDWTKGQQEPNSITLLDGNNPISGRACSITLYPSTVNSGWGLASNATGSYAPYWFDYPKLDVGTNDVYLATNLISNGVENVVPVGEASVMIRFGLADLQNSCLNGGSPTINWWQHPSQNGFQGFGFAQDSTALPQYSAAMIWAVHLANDKLRIYIWPETTDYRGVQQTDLGHTPYKPPSNEKCAAPDGGDPCVRVSDDITGWTDTSAGTVSFMWGAGATGPTGYPYLAIVTFFPPALFPTGPSYRICAWEECHESALYNPNFAVIYSAGGDNAQGQPAVAFFVSGGGQFPSTGILLPGSLTYTVGDQGRGAGGAGPQRWGDYIRVRPYQGGLNDAWIATGYIYNSAGNLEGHLYEFSVTGVGPASTSATVQPRPVIYYPTNGTNFNLNQQYNLIGFARNTQPGVFGYVPCNQMQFQIKAPDGSTQTLTPTEDPSYQQSGWCDSQVSFSVAGQALITLTATVDSLSGTASAFVNVVSAQQQTTPFSFTIAASPDSALMYWNTVSSTSITVVINPTAGTPQPVQLSVSGLPTDVSYSFSANPVTPNGLQTVTLTLTCQSCSTGDFGTYNLTISGTGGGYTAQSNTVTLEILSAPA